MFPRRTATVAGLAAAALVLSACAESEREEPTDNGDAGQTGGTGGTAAPSGGRFVFGAAGAPSTFDPFYASDGENFRVTRQMYEGLIEYEAGGVEPGPGLATEWESSEDGLTWTFTLREGVTFHDGEPFDAEAVCANFERMYNQNESGQLQAATSYWQSDWGGFAGTDTESLYESCEASDEFTADITITRVTSKFPTILGQSAYAMQSPAAMEEFGANDISIEGDAVSYPEYALEHPTGTGPFRFEGYDEATQTVTMVRNEDYWGEPAGVDELVIRAITDETTRRQELEAGAIDGYDLPNPVDWAALEEAGNQVIIRDPFNILYLALNPETNDALLEDDVRMALFMAIDREELVSTQLPDGAEVATQLIPPTVTGYNESLEAVPYDPEGAQQMLADAGYADLELDFWYPTEVTRPYMPDPQRIFDAVRADWEEIGITVNPVARPWNGGYLDGVQGSQAPAYFLGWTGDYDSPDNFLGNFFGSANNAFATDLYPWGEQLSTDLRAADSEPDEEARIGLYEELNASLAEWLPALPISHSPPAIVVSGQVQGLIASPLTAEKFDTVTVERD